MVSFMPPPIKDAQARDTVQRSLHAAGATCLTEAARVVQPYIHTMHKVACHVHIVIFDKGYFALKIAVYSQVIYLVEEIFRGEIGGMRLAGEYYLNRAQLVIYYALETLYILENQSGALIFSETAYKSNSEHVRVKQCAHRQHLVGCHLTISPVFLGSIQEGSLALAFQKLANCPEFIVRYVHNTLPELGVVVLLYPVFVQVFLVESPHLRSNPGGHMDAVGYMRNRHFFLF